MTERKGFSWVFARREMLITNDAADAAFLRCRAKEHADFCEERYVDNEIYTGRLRRSATYP
jgi:hypothetical protein